MLLKEYLLLHMGRLAPVAAQRWQAEMAARRRIGAAQDLLCFWQPAYAAVGFEPGTLVAFAVVGARLAFGRELTSGVLAAGLVEAGRKALAATGGTGEPVAEVRAVEEVVLGQVVLPLGELPERALASAVAYYFEEEFGYAPADRHPVAQEESLHPER